MKLRSFIFIFNLLFFKSQPLSSLFKCTARALCFSAFIFLHDEPEGIYSWGNHYLNPKKRRPVAEAAVQALMFTLPPRFTRFHRSDDTLRHFGTTRSPCYDLLFKCCFFFFPLYITSCMKRNNEHS